jgi:hypothetical protein
MISKSSSEHAIRPAIIKVYISDYRLLSGKTLI